MKKLALLIVISVFGLGVLVVFLSRADVFQLGSAAAAKIAYAPPIQPAAAPTPDAGGDKSIPKTFALAKDSLSEYGEVAFDHDAHAFKQDYSADGKSVMGCVECHHTDQPKAALKAPDVTSQRDVTLTFDVWKTTTQKVSECRSCHFQDGNIPDGKTMPSANGKDMNNQLAFHINCNTCHDAAFKLRPDLKKTNKTFATTSDCTVCHKSN